MSLFPGDYHHREFWETQICSGMLSASLCQTQIQYLALRTDKTTKEDRDTKLKNKCTVLLMCFSNYECTVYHM